MSVEINLDVNVNTVALSVVAIFQAITALLSIYTHRVAKETKIAAERTEKNTNSITEALVVATGKSEHAKGKEEGRAEGEVRAAALAKSKTESP